MKAVLGTIGGSILLGVVAFVIAAGVNAARSEGKLSWTKAYFAKRDVTPPIVHDSNEDSSATDRTLTSTATDAATGGELNGVATEAHRAGPVNDGSGSEGDVDSAEPELAFGYQLISTDEVADIVSDPNYDRYRFVIVDARSRSAYEAGHIGGAIRCYHYELDACLDNLLAFALGAEKVIVYCNGGDCEDSKFMCQELVDQGVPWSVIYLYADGWKDWVAQDMSYEEGAE